MTSDISIELDNIKNQIIQKYSPSKIILFGSQAKDVARKNSDIDLCIIKNTENKKDLLIDIYMNVDSSKPLDVLLYTETEWNECINDSTSFAYLINKKGIQIYG